MIKISNSTNIYVFCPANITTGGAELLHQLVHILNGNGRQAYIVYYDTGKVSYPIISGNVPNDYLKYNVKVSLLEDFSNEDIVVLFEAVYDKYKLYINSQIIFWWLSVDNFYYASKRYISLKDGFNWNFNFGVNLLLYKTYYLFRKKENFFINNLSLNDISKLNFLHLYQSEYAQNFLQNKGIKEMLALKDFINDEFFQNDVNVIVEKKNIILYNPKKGIEFTKKVIKAFPNYNWIPLINMSRSEMISYMQKAKLYIDFGFHPGKDRIPREAAMSNCCIITGYDGSAGFFEDVAINSVYKIDKKNSNINKIGELIGSILENYEQHISNFYFYRERISKEKNEFITQVKDIFMLS